MMAVVLPDSFREMNLRRNSAKIYLGGTLPVGQLVGPARLFREDESRVAYNKTS